jgi:predicted permease
MLPYIDAFVPAFGLLALGAFLKRSLLPDDAVWAGIERLIFWVLLPALLFSAIGSVQLGEVPVGGMMLAIWLALASGTAASVALARGFAQGHASMTSVLMGGIRFNNLIGFAVAGRDLRAARRGAGRGGDGADRALRAVRVQHGLCARPAGAVPPLAGAAADCAESADAGLPRRLRVSWAGGLPPGVRPMAEALGRASVALGLLAVGAALSLGAMRDRLALQFATAALKLVAMPGLTLALCLALGLDPLPTAMAVLFMALPTAATSYVMARAMGGDAPLMAAITSSEHMLSVLTLPLWLWLVARLTGLG